MKSIILLVVVFSLIVIPVTAKSQTASNVVYVDLQRVMIESDKGKEVKKLLTGEVEKLKKNLDVKQNELQKLKDGIERQASTLTPEARATKEKEYQGKLKDYQRLYNDYQTELQQKDMEFTQKILKEIEEVIKSIGKSEKFSIILEKSQAGILYGSSASDITNTVIRSYNEWIKKKPTGK